MTAATITLNPGTGGPLVLTDTLTTVDGAAAPASAQAQLAKLAWGAANSANMVSAVQPMPTSLNATIFRFSTVNTSASQLAAAATFTGVIETALDQPAVSILMACDQPMTLTLRQFIDVGGTRAAPDIVFFVDANVGFGRSMTLNGNFVQVLAQNTGAATTTTFSLDTAYGAIDAADGAGAVPVTELPLILTGAAAQTAIVNNILPPAAGAAGLNIAGMRAATVQVASTATGGTFIFEQSNDNVTWAALPVFNAALVTAVPITAAITGTVSAIVYTLPLRCTRLRLRIVTAMTGGSIRAFSRISSEPWTATVQLVGSPTAANCAVTASLAAAQTLATVTTVATVSNVAAIAAGANAIGDVGIQYRGNATGAASSVSVMSAATPTAVTVKATAGRLLGWQLQNSSAGLRSVKVFNAAAPTLGTTAAVFEIDIPTGASISLQLPGGISFGTACTFSVTSAKGLTDNTATGLAATDVSGSFFFA